MFYQAHSLTGPPTQAKVHDILANEEYINKLTGGGVIGEARFISKGLNLERDQYVYVFKLIECSY